MAMKAGTNSDGRMKATSNAIEVIALDGVQGRVSGIGTAAIGWSAGARLRRGQSLPGRFRLRLKRRAGRGRR